MKTTFQTILWNQLILVLILGLGWLVPIRYSGAQEPEKKAPEKKAEAKQKITCDDGGPCLIDPPDKKEGITLKQIFGPKKSAVTGIDLTKQPWLVESANLPENHPALSRERMVWAESFHWVPLPEVLPQIPVERWLKPLPPEKAMAGKYILIEAWATWCPPCRRSLPYLNFIQEKYRDDLVVIAICETSEDEIRSMPGNVKLEDIKFSLATDTGRRFATKLGVFGIPHAVLLEPLMGGVVWEGMPTLPGHELSDKVLEKIFAIGRKLRAEDKLPKDSPVKFIVKEPTAEEKEARLKRKHCSYSDLEGENGGPSLDGGDKSSK